MLRNRLRRYTGHPVLWPRLRFLVFKRVSAAFGFGITYQKVLVFLGNRTSVCFLLARFRLDVVFLHVCQHGHRVAA